MIASLYFLAPVHFPNPENNNQKVARCEHQANNDECLTMRPCQVHVCSRPIRRHGISIAAGGWVCTTWTCFSETNHWAECNTQVVVGTTIEINFITNIQT
jgi:hypothetical protein